MVKDGDSIWAAGGVKLEITRTYSFSAAHHLPDNDGKCNRPHGHNYHVELTLSGIRHKYGPDKGMIMNLSNLDHAMQELILNRADHNDLNAFLENSSYWPTTIENITRWIFDEIALWMIGNEFAQIESVLVRETPRQWAKVSRGVS